MMELEYRAVLYLSEETKDTTPISLLMYISLSLVLSELKSLPETRDSPKMHCWSTDPLSRSTELMVSCFLAVVVSVLNQLCN